MDGDITNQIERLADLRSRGHITDEEYEKVKADLLAGPHALGAARPMQRVPNWTPPAPQPKRDPFAWIVGLIAAIAVVIIVVVAASRSGDNEANVGSASSNEETVPAEQAAAQPPSSGGDDGALSDEEYRELRLLFINGMWLGISPDTSKADMEMLGGELCQRAQTRRFSGAVQSMKEEMLLDNAEARNKQGSLQNILEGAVFIGRRMCRSYDDTTYEEPGPLVNPWVSSS